MWLCCSRRCGGALFKAMAAEVVVDSAGLYQDHAITQPMFACLNCGAPAVDLAAVPEAISSEAAAESRANDILCPVCETAVRIQPGDDCPNCGAPISAG